MWRKATRAENIATEPQRLKSKTCLVSCTTNCENSLRKRDFFLIEPRSGGQNCSPGRSEAEAGVRHYLQISPAMRGARGRGGHRLSPLPGLARMGRLTPGSASLHAGLQIWPPLRGSIRNLSFFVCGSVALSLCVLWLISSHVPARVNRRLVQPLTHTHRLKGLSQDSQTFVNFT